MKGIWKMGFWGGFAAVLIVAVVLFVYFREKLRKFSRMAFGTNSILKGLKQNELLEQTTPKSLSGCDSLLLPQIRKDFPDFNADLAKTYAKQALAKHLKGKNELKIHNIVFYRYNRYNNEKVIIMQAAVQFRENGKLCQKRYNLNYTYMLGVGEDYTRDAANCPNCGAPASRTGVQVCEYCGSRISDVLANTWEFTEIYEK